MDKLFKYPTSPESAYETIAKRLKEDSNPRKNVESFVTAEMDEWANRLYYETFGKNAIDKSENPQTTAIENECWRILADLWNCPDVDNAIGCSTIGSSEACMMAGLAMKRRWEENGGKGKPNIIISSATHVCWQKFCNYFDVEPRCAPILEHHKVLDGYGVLPLIDKNTIGVVAILGITYTGQFDDILNISQMLNAISIRAGIDVSIHIDAASGGMISPFLHPDLLWDFRLRNVVSINTSGHKYGLVYPGLGWIIWRHKDYLPDSLIHYVDYLGGHMPTWTLNFSRPGSQILLQYWAFLRYGFEGFKVVQERSLSLAKYLASEIERMNIFQLWADQINIPVFAWKLNPKYSFTLYELSDKMLNKGWMLPAYQLPYNMQDITVQRIAVRNDMTLDTANEFLEDLQSSINELN